MESPSVILSKRRKINSQQLSLMAHILKTIAHPLRLQVIEMLEAQGELCVGDILREVDTEPSLLSHHLNRMKDKGVLVSDRRGRQVYYRLAFQAITSIFDCMEKCELFDEGESEPTSM